MNLSDDRVYEHAFHEAAMFSRAYEKLRCRTPTLDQIARVFVRNMNRAQGLATFPIQLVASATINEAARVEALASKNIPFRDPRITYGHPGFEKALFDEVDTERQRLVAEWMKETSMANRFTTIGVQGMGAIIEWNKNESWQSVQAAMAAILMGLWTAFEVLMQDAWIAAVNSHPIPLAQRMIESPATIDAGLQVKSFSFKDLLGAHFDFTDSMGTALLRKRAVDFQSFKSICSAYKIAFAEELEPIFASAGANLAELEAVRNLFAHKGGTIDRKFLNRVRGVAELKEAKEGQLLFITGHYVAAKANAVAECATKLVSAVDDWLLANPDEGEKT